MTADKVAVFRRGHFNAAHRLALAEWTDAENFAYFGPCSYPHFHGHNYEVEVKVVGVPDPQTGYVIDLKLVNTYLEEEVYARFDHKNLNLDTEFFKNQLPTAENIVKVIYQLLRKRLAPQLDLQVRLYETPRNFVEYPVGI
ncbi:MAG: 6-carboxytetrahydropterin synthase [Chitinophagaceae bacterium]